MAPAALDNNLENGTVSEPGNISLPAGFQINAVNFSKGKPHGHGHLQASPPSFDQVPISLDGAPLTKNTTPPLDVLKNFRGTFQGNGFNVIWRPNNRPSATQFPNPVDPAPPTPPHEAVLELNLTKETLSFAKELGAVPNRGLFNQRDIFLNGIPYTQNISDVTNEETGSNDGPETGIHFEPGLWMHVPATDVHPVLGASLNRMASIPHGTTINAQGFTPTAVLENTADEVGIENTINFARSGTFVGRGPNFFPLDITPFPIGNPAVRIPVFKKSMTVAEGSQPRLPQDLTAFNKTGHITDAILADINLVLHKANENKVFVSSTVFTVSTNPLAPNGINADDTGPPQDTPVQTLENAATFGGGAANIAFLTADNPKLANVPTNGDRENATAMHMTSTFWVNTIEHTITVKRFRPGQDKNPFVVSAPVPNAGHPVTKFRLDPPREIKDPIEIKVRSTEIQYSQNVDLNFANLTWPHVSVATLVPNEPMDIGPDHEAWNALQHNGQNGQNGHTATEAI